MQILNQVTELNKGLCIYIGKGPTSALYLDGHSYTFAVIFPKNKVGYFEQFGINLPALFAMDFLPIVEGKDVVSAINNLAEFIAKIPLPQLENYLENIHSYFIGLADSYIPSTDCSNQEFRIRHIDFTLPDYLAAIDKIEKNKVNHYINFSYNLNSGEIPIKVKDSALLGSQVKYHYNLRSWSSLVKVDSITLPLDSKVISTEVDTFLDRFFTKETLEIISQSFVHEEYI